MKSKDIPNSVIYLLAALLLVTLAIQAVVFLNYRPPVQYDFPVTGQQTAQGTVGLVILGVCTGPIVEGWNLISLCANVTDNSIDSILAGIDFRFVMQWNKTGQDFLIYSPLAATNPFTTMEINRSYFVFLNDATGIIEPSGSFLPDLDIALVEGWDTPAYPYEFTANFTDYFDDTVHKFQMKWNSTDQEFVIWSPRSADPPSSLMFLGDGQFILSSQANTLSYNRTNLTG